MVSIEEEDQRYGNEVQSVKEWWNDSRWRHTTRPFTAEQIVAKRGNLDINYASNAMSKKLWSILERHCEVSLVFVAIDIPY
jgi:isocitrate lyase